MRHILVALVQDEPGLLARMASLFARRGYNIESFTAGHSEIPGQTRITIVVEGANTVLDQIAKQFRKLIGVVKVVDLTAEGDYLAHEMDYLAQEMMLVKVRVDSQTRPEVVSLADLFKARILDVSRTTLTLELTAQPDRLRAFEDVLKPFGIEEQARTGVVAMNLGPKTLADRPTTAAGVGS